MKNKKICNISFALTMFSLFFTQGMAKQHNKFIIDYNKSDIIIENNNMNNFSQKQLITLLRIIRNPKYKQGKEIVQPNNRTDNKAVHDAIDMLKSEPYNKYTLTQLIDRVKEIPGLGKNSSIISLQVLS